MGSALNDSHMSRLQTNPRNQRNHYDKKEQYCAKSAAALRATSTSPNNPWKINALRGSASTKGQLPCFVWRLLRFQSAVGPRRPAFRWCTHNCLMDPLNNKQGFLHRHQENCVIKTRETYCRNTIERFCRTEHLLTYKR
jgi:hypothetical protein